MSEKFENGYMDFTMSCSNCGHEKVIFANDPEGTGRKIEHIVAGENEFKMACEECGTTLRWFYKEALNPPAPEENEEEIVEPEVDSVPEVKEEDNEPVQEESKEEEQVS